ncbi:response regulator [Paenibacillus contaminans]|uniref:DNA-binding response regulator n=1 Tax=Paenibacillus contaminans TaxID=450362 RepID=A0A329MEY3_9BACL|nr:response regulator [Paenibacillus contaminans]RAV17786.1 DNA-binding response regulator [Paenibacillus contaminans]
MIRVMLIDDEEDALDLLEILLGQIGNVQIAGRYINPFQALEALSRTAADAVFLDIEMPGLKGTEAARQIRTISPQLPIIFTTAYVQYAVEAFEIQSTDYLLKPFTMERLQNTMARIQKSLLEPAAPSSPSASLAPKVLCLGGFHIELSGETGKTLTWKTKKERELCALLIHCEGRPVNAATIIEALWPGYDLNKAKTYLYTCLSYLRKSLAEGGVPIRIQKTDQGFAAELDGLAVDVFEFERLLGDVLAEGMMDDYIYDKMNGLYKGEYMEACDFGWTTSRQLELKASYVRALRRWYAHFRSRSRPALAIDSLQKLLSLAPDSELDGRELIRLHLELGNRNEAYRVCLQLEQAVRVQLGAELEEETKQLFRQTMEKSERTSQ